MSKNKEIFNLTNTLSCLPHLSVGKNVVIFLRNDCFVAGKVVSADGFMNICLENVVYCDQKGLHYQMDNYAVRFRQILYFVQSHKLNYTETIEKFLNQINKPKEKKQSNLKAKRAFARTQATANDTKNMK